LPDGHRDRLAAAEEKLKAEALRALSVSPLPPLAEFQSDTEITIVSARGCNEVEMRAQ